ncbi:MAG: hypothetical protein ABEJ98_05180, partial [Candidatus Nanohaloarchaea archaeon]
IASGNTDVVPDEFRTIATLKLEDGEAVTFGRGTSENPLQAQGFIYGKFVDSAGNRISGNLRITVRTKSGNLVGYVTKKDLDEIDAGASNRSERVPFSIQRVNGSAKIADPYVLHLEMRADSAATFDYDGANSLKADGYHHER